ncbi:hypothetical protein [Butyrivibrio sp. VCD2006]|uniref:hypothetical protein n=1 Tax=Butyrivibrio sp. VCD2006 TaxID=1280664 RepID=UPI00047E3E92|nr:hypothetical protein [Butyrivibrio sp. VCD2006]
MTNFAGEDVVMGKIHSFDKKRTTIIEAVEYNGRYTDISTIRTRIIAAGIIIIASAAFICAQLFWI